MSIRSSSETVEDSGTGSSLVIDVPSGVQNGDLLVLVIKAATVYTSYTDWTTQYTGALTGSPGEAEHSFVGTRIASSEPASYTLPSPGFTDGYVVQMIAVKDHGLPHANLLAVVSQESHLTVSGDIHTLVGFSGYDSFFQILMFTAYQEFIDVPSGQPAAPTFDVTTIRESYGDTLIGGTPDFLVERYIMSYWERTTPATDAHGHSITPQGTPFIQVGLRAISMFIPEVVTPTDTPSSGPPYIRRHATAKALPYTITTGRLQGVPWHEIGE